MGRKNTRGLSADAVSHVIGKGQMRNRHINSCLVIIIVCFILLFAALYTIVVAVRDWWDEFVIKKAPEENPNGEKGKINETPDGARLRELSVD